ncbi:MAG TPA: hypothetical protein VFW75_06730, partial [Acetobacteraceae bacterium]|nr:hypothetical protein [Acetobacteraceae bacterium]
TPRCHICVADDGPALAVDGGCIPAGEIGAVWHRRVAAPAVLASLRPGYRNFAARELGAMLDAFLESILGLHVNRFDADRLAGNRLLQASRAVAAGLDVPTTLVTQDAERGKAFLAQHPAVDMNGG